MRFFFDVENNGKAGLTVSLVSILLSALLAEAADTPP